MRVNRVLAILFYIFVMGWYYSYIAKSTKGTLPFVYWTVALSVVLALVLYVTKTSIRRHWIVLYGLLTLALLIIPTNTLFRTSYELMVVWINVAEINVGVVIVTAIHLAFRELLVKPA